MPDSPPPSELPDPRNQTAVDAWIEARSLILAEQIAVTLQRIVTSVYTDFIASIDETSLTAAGDPSILDNIIPLWRMAIPTITQTIEETYYEGGISAYGIAEGASAISPEVAAGWTKVINYSAIDYMTRATNRLVGVGDTVWNQVSKRTAAAIEKGLSSKKLADELRYYRDEFAGYRADVIARTEINGAYNNGKFDGDSALGPYGPVEKVWRASSDARTRADHVAADGQVRPFSQPFSVGGVTMMAPHAPGAPASQVVNCRCWYNSLYAGDRRPDGTIVKPGDLPTPGLEPETMEVIPDGAEIVEPEPARYGRGTNGPRTFIDTIVLDESSGGSKKRRDNIREVVKSMDEVHGLPDDGLGNVMIRLGGATKSRGGHFTPATRGPKPRLTRKMSFDERRAAIAEYNARPITPEIRINAGQSLGEALTVAHELGHRTDVFVPQSGIFARNSFKTARAWNSSTARDLQAKYRGDWLQHLDEVTDEETRLVLTLGKLARESESMKNYVKVNRAGAEYTAYFYDIKEVWARAYSQWMATASGNQMILDDLAKQIAEGYQFTADEMILIAPVIEGLLRVWGYMR